MIVEPCSNHPISSPRRKVASQGSRWGSVAQVEAHIEESQADAGDQNGCDRHQRQQRLTGRRLRKRIRAPYPLSESGYGSRC